MSMISTILNKTFLLGDTKRDAGLTTPDDIVRYDAISYGPDPKWNILDVYRPKNAEGKTLPVIINVHGGGWAYGTTETYQFYCMSLAQQGFAVVSYNYTYAPYAKFPTPLKETNMVFEWVLKNAEGYGFDCNNLFAVGDSAGGQLLGLYAGILTDPAMAKKYNIAPPEGAKLNAVALNCGAYKITENILLRLLMKDYLVNAKDPAERALQDVAGTITPSFPPAFVMTSTGDFIRAQAPFLVEDLKKNNVPHVYKIYGDDKNKLPHVFHCDIKRPEAAVCNKEECDFFKQYVK